MKHTRLALLILPLLGILCLPALAQQPGQVRAHATGAVPQETLDDFVAGFAGDAEAMTRAMKASDAILARDPKNVEALAWNSAGKGAQSGEYFRNGDFKTGIKMWQESKAGLNQAVDAAPDNPTIRIVRGKSMLEVSLHDPNPFTSKQAAALAVTDLEHAIDVMGPYFEKASQDFRKEMFAWLFESASKSGDKDKAAKYKGLAGDKAGDAIDRLNQSAENTVIESAKSALIILDSPLVKEIKGELMSGLRAPARLDALIATLDAKADAAPEDAAPQAWRGFTRLLRTSSMYAQGRIEEANKAWEKGVNEINAAASTDATNPDALLLRALANLERARQEPDADKAADYRARSLSDLGRFQRQANDSGVKLSADATAALAITNGRVYLMSRDTKNARAAFDAAVAANPSPELTKRAKSIAQFVDILEKK